MLPALVEAATVDQAGDTEELQVRRRFCDATRTVGGTNEMMAEILGRKLGLDGRKYATSCTRG